MADKLKVLWKRSNQVPETAMPVFLGQLTLILLGEVS